MRTHWFTLTLAERIADDYPDYVQGNAQLDDITGKLLATGCDDATLHTRWGDGLCELRTGSPVAGRGHQVCHQGGPKGRLQRRQGGTGARTRLIDSDPARGPD